MTTVKDSIIISGLANACVQPEAVAHDYKDEKWLAYNYATDDFEGEALFCGPYQDAPEIDIPLNHKGWCRIYLGIHYGMPAWPLESRVQLAGMPSSSLFILRVRLSSDSWRGMIEAEYTSAKQQGYFRPAPDTPKPRPINWNAIDEVYWRTAELDGQTLRITPHREAGHEWSSACLAYIRLEPMDENDLREYRRTLPRPETRRMVGSYDGSHPPLCEEEARKWLEPLRGSDFEAVFWGASLLDLCFYPTKVGSQIFDPWHYPSVANRRLPLDKNFDCLKTAAEICHEMNIECLGSMRAAGGRFPPSHLPAQGKLSFFHKHPEFWCRTEKGEPAGHLSLAFPEARCRQIEIMQDYLDGRSLDGVHYHFNRCCPFIAYEQPVIDDFMRHHGVDPRSLPWDDERWIRHKCGYITTFMRELRAMLDAEGNCRKKRLKLALTVMNSLENNLLNGYDLDTWIKEGLTDYLLIHPCWYPFQKGDHRVTPETVKPIQQLAHEAGKDCKVYADLFPRYQPAEYFRQQAICFYEAGIYGVGLHDYYCRMPRMSEWDMLRLLGHREEIKEWREKAFSFGRARPLKSICGMSNDPRYTVLSNG